MVLKKERDWIRHETTWGSIERQLQVLMRSFYRFGKTGRNLLEHEGMSIKWVGTHSEYGKLDVTKL